MMMNLKSGKKRGNEGSDADTAYQRRFCKNRNSSGFSTFLGVKQFDIHSLHGFSLQMLSDLLFQFRNLFASGNER